MVDEPWMGVHAHLWQRNLKLTVRKSAEKEFLAARGVETRKAMGSHG
jgi:hypothetical protein